MPANDFRHEMRESELDSALNTIATIIPFEDLCHTRASGYQSFGGELRRIPPWKKQS
jgi:hypothetical protein